MHQARAPQFWRLQPSPAGPRCPNSPAPARESPDGTEAALARPPPAARGAPAPQPPRRRRPLRVPPRHRRPGGERADNVGRLTPGSRAVPATVLRSSGFSPFHFTVSCLTQSGWPERTLRPSGASRSAPPADDGGTTTKEGRKCGGGATGERTEQLARRTTEARILYAKWKDTTVHATEHFVFVVELLRRAGLRCIPWTH